MQEFENVHTQKKVIREDATDKPVAYDGKMMIVEMDTAGIITYTNRKFRDMTGYNREELEGLPYSISRHPDVPEIMCQQAFTIASEGKIWAGYIKSITRGGEYFWTSVCVQPKFDMQKNLIGYIINKKKADREVVEGVEGEYIQFKHTGSVHFKSEYCGELHTIQHR